MYICSSKTFALTRPQLFKSFSDLLVRPNKAEVLQLDGGGVLLVWKPVLPGDEVTYCVQCCTEGGFPQIIQHTVDNPFTPNAAQQWTIDPHVQRKPLAFQKMLICSDRVRFYLSL